MILVIIFIKIIIILEIVINSIPKWERIFYLFFPEKKILKSERFFNIILNMMKKEDIKKHEDYKVFWKQERKKCDNKEITEEELSNILKEAIKITKEQERKTYLETNEDLLCNNCSESLLEFWDGKWVYGLKNCVVRGGYCSPVLDDLIKYKFNLCEKCLKEMFNKFKIPIIWEEYSPFDGLTKIIEK